MWVGLIRLLENSMCKLFNRSYLLNENRLKMTCSNSSKVWLYGKGGRSVGKGLVISLSSPRFAPQDWINQAMTKSYESQHLRSVEARRPS